MLLDGEPVRRKARGEYDKLQRDIDQARKERDRHLQVDQPEYNKWLHRNFGATLTELRAAAQKVAAAESLVFEVETEFFLGGYRSISKAYAQVKKWREEPKEARPPTEEERAEHQEAEREFEEQLRDLYEEIFEAEPDPEEFERAQQKQRGRGGPRGFDSGGSTAASRVHQHGRLKELYRQLVRRLHPDHAGKLTAQEVEWWHQTQAAYKRGDTEKLEMIFTLTEIARGGPREANVGLLKRLAAEFRKTLGALRSELKRLRTDPAWRFSTRTDRDDLFARTKWELQRQLSEMTNALSRYKLQIEAWEQSLRKPGRKRSQRATEEVPL